MDKRISKTQNVELMEGKAIISRTTDKCMDTLNSQTIIHDVIDSSSLQSSDKNKSCIVFLYYIIEINGNFASVVDLNFTRILSIFDENSLKFDYFFISF
jgi:hypothetical protein